jgi:putative NADH-flavin reductase
MVARGAGRLGRVAPPVRVQVSWLLWGHMKIAVYGGTGRVGSRIVAEAISRGHDVTALSRHGGTGVTVGDATDLDRVRQIAEAHDVVVSALGPSRVPGDDPAAFAGIVGGLVSAVGATRLVVAGGAGSLLVAPGVRLVDTPDFPQIYKTEALATAEAFDAVREAGPELDWTYLSPAPEMGPGERTGRYVSGLDEPVGNSITFDDFAVALVDEIERPSHRRQRFTVASS